MISFFRRALSSWIVLALFGLIMIAFIITGVGTPNGLGDISGGGDSLASVEGNKIGAAEVIEEVGRQLTRARTQQPDIDMAAFLREGALDEVLKQMISAKAMMAFGHDQGLATSKKMIDGEIASIPAFRNLAGQFDEDVFRQALRSQKVSEQQLRDDIASSLMERQVLLPLAQSPKVPQAMALQYASLLLEQRTGSVGIVPPQAMGPGTEPTDAEVTAFYRANATRYTIPERRVLRYALFGAQQAAAAAQPTEAEIAAAYKANEADYGAKETRTLSQVVLPDQASARAFAAKVAAGASFAQAAAQAGFSAADTQLGKQSRDAFVKLASPAVAQAAFAAAQGATTQPLQSPLGWHIVRVDAIATVPARPLAAVRGEIARRLGQQKSEDALAAQEGRIEDSLGNGSSFEEVAKAEKLQILETPPITALGIQFDDPTWRAPELAPVLKTAFDMSPDEDPVVETLVPNQRFAILGVARVVPAAPPPLAQVRDKVRADLIAHRAVDRAKAVAASIVAKINAGTPAAQAFAEAKLPLPPVQKVTLRRLDAARPNQPVTPPLAMLFSIPPGKARLLQAPNGGGWFVVHLESRVAGDAGNAPGLVEATRGQFEQILGVEYASQFRRAIEQTLDIKRDAAAAARARKALLGPGAQ